jgi:hypothetical protein
LWPVVVAVVAVYGLAIPVASHHDDDRDRNWPASQHFRGNAFVNDPCLDPPPPFFERTVQSETEIAVLNAVRRDRDDGDRDDWDDDDKYDRRADRDDDDEGENRSGRLLVAGYNDSYGLYDTQQGLSGFSYSTNGGERWIDGGGLPPAGLNDRYLGHPVVVVHHRTRTFYYASLYQNPAGAITVSVNRGRFKIAPQQVPIESFASARCANRPELYGVPDPPAHVRERIIWDPPAEAIAAIGDDFDRHWLYVNQETGVLYLTYTRVGFVDGSTPVELVRSFDGGQTWTAPSVIVPNLIDTFNQAPKAVVTPTGRVVVTWLAHTFPFFGAPEEHRVETAFSDTCKRPEDPCVFSAPIIVDRVNPQGTPPGDNRFANGELIISNNPYIAVDKGRDDGRVTRGERRQPGFGNVYITYFDGKTPFENPLCDPSDFTCFPFASAANILLARSADNGSTYKPPVKVNDDPGDTSHVFPSTQVNKFGEVFVTWIDRRRDQPRNILNDTWGDISSSGGRHFGRDGRISTVSTDWFVRADYLPNFGNYNSSDVIGFTDFISIWADGRFPKPGELIPLEGFPFFDRDPADAATPDSFTGIVKRHRSRDR